MLKIINTFWIKYKVYEGCSLCNELFEEYEYFEPSIQISLMDLLDNKSLTEIKKKECITINVLV